MPPATEASTTDRPGTTRPEVVGIDPERVTGWFTGHVPGVVPPLTFDLVAGGRSNLTFRVEGAVLRDQAAAGATFDEAAR